MTVVEELVNARTESDGLKAKLTETETALVKAVADLVATGKERDVAVAKVAEIEAAHVVAIKQVNDSLVAEQSAHVATKAELDKAQKALANPAFAAAAAVGDKNAVKEGAPAGAVVEFANKAEAQKAYALIDGSTVEGAKAREKFRTEHAELLGLVK